jgi:hypothetical protein
LVAVLAAVLVTGGREPSADVLATAPILPTAQGADTPGVASSQAPVRLPDPSGRAVRAPASSAKPRPLKSLPDALGIPAVALAAYQSAAAVIDTADPSCHLDWSTLAAIGQVESDQGRADGSSLDRQGIAHPRIIGPRLDGKHGTSLVRDTDAGRLDGDTRFDRAVGPMQFLPSTWAAVAVDADGDGRRDVQDINDASLGSAVYLCADHDDLATKAGARAALLRYNHSEAYARLVMAIARHYRASGIGLPVTDVDTRPVSFTDPGGRHRRGHGHQHGHQHGHHGHRHHGPVTTDPVPPTPTPTPSPTDPPTPGGPTYPGGPTSPPEPPIIPDPVPAELASLTPGQVSAYDDAWAVCDDDLASGWSADPYSRAALTQCLADQLGVPIDDTDLVTFVDWVAVYEDGYPGGSTDGPTDGPTDGSTDAPTVSPTQ